MAVTLVSWNVHAWVGSDAARDPARAFAALRTFDADVVALQEVEGEDWQELARDLGFRVVRANGGSSAFGNALLVRDPVLGLREVDLSVPGRERRTALDAIVSLSGSPQRIVTTHLGLRAAERRRQAVQLARHLREHEAQLPVALLGDLNDWTPWGTQIRPLARTLGPLSRIRTFPSRRPLFPLDRAAWRIPGVTGRLASIREPNVRSASDHLPLRLELGDG